MIQVWCTVVYTHMCACAHTYAVGGRWRFEMDAQAVGLFWYIIGLFCHLSMIHDTWHTRRTLKIWSGCASSTVACATSKYLSQSIPPPDNLLLFLLLLLLLFYYYQEYLISKHREYLKTAPTHVLQTSIHSSSSSYSLYTVTAEWERAFQRQVRSKIFPTFPLHVSVPLPPLIL